MKKHIVLLHGWGASVTKLEPLKKSLETLGWKTLLLKLPGFDAADPKNAWAVSDYAGYVSDKAQDKFKGDKFIVFGHSFGGRISIKLSASQNSKLAGVVLCASGGLSRGSTLKRLVFYALAKAGRLLFLGSLVTTWKRLLYKLAREHDYEKTSGIMREVFRKVVEEDLRPYVSKMSHPTLILWGKEDRVTPLKDANFLKENLQSKSKLVTYENVGHTLPYVLPKQIAKEINNWAKTFA